MKRPMSAAWTDRGEESEDGGWWALAEGGHLNANLASACLVTFWSQKRLGSTVLTHVELPGRGWSLLPWQKNGTDFSLSEGKCGIGSFFFFFFLSAPPSPPISRVGI